MVDDRSTASEFEKESKTENKIKVIHKINTWLFVEVTTEN
jgi:hypothetical protein